MPKRGFATITKRDVGFSVENAHILLGARVVGADPNLSGVMPFHPWPSQM
jgi:hypothetical protein